MEQGAVREKTTCRECIYSSPSFFTSGVVPSDPKETKYVTLVICKVIDRKCLYEGKVRPSWCPLDWGYPLPKKLLNIGTVSKYAMMKAGIHKYKGKRGRKKGFHAKER